MKQADLKLLSIEDIHLDVENPRIRQCLECYTQVTAEAISLALKDNGDGDAASSFRTLRDSIKESGGIIHPILVNQETDGRYVVIEGNTRVQIYKDFQEKGTPGNWSQIPALIYQGLSEIEKHSIRLQSHLVGPRDWDPYSKAKYLYQLSVIDQLPMHAIINMCGGNANEISKSIDAYDYMKSYYEPYARNMNIDMDIRDYSKFREHENTKIKNAIQRKGFNENQFAKWVVEGNVDKAQNVRQIPMVMNDPEAWKTFLKENLSEAVKVMHANELSDVDLSEYPYELLADTLYKKMMDISLMEVDELANNKEKARKRNSLERLKDKLEFIIESIRERER